MRVLLIDIDSKIPNLALMKLSSWHKAHGDTVLRNWYFGEYDKVYASCIFKENRHQINELIFPNLVAGGSGTEDWQTILPDDVEHTMPDYNFYNSSYSMGYTTRGCFRGCPWCIVQQKEGKLREHSDIYEWWDRTHDLLVFLDNNILGLEKHFLRICGQVLKEGLRVDFNQGLDIRLMDGHIAKILASLRHLQYRFAFDRLSDEAMIRRGIRILKKHGLARSTFYVLVGFDTSTEEDLHRLNVLRQLGQDACVMRYKKERKYIRMAQWAAFHGLFRTHTFEEFKKLYKKSRPRAIDYV